MGDSSDPRTRLHELEIRARRIASGDGSSQVQLLVYCPSQERTLSMSECANCEDCEGVALDATERHSVLICRSGAEGPRPEPRHGALGRQAAPTSAAATTEVRSIMSTNVQCVRADVSIETVAALLLERGISALPVVDEQGHAIGVISKTDLVRARSDDAGTEAATVRIRSAAFEYELGPGFHAERIASATAGEVMTPFAFSVPEDTPISRAAALMGYEGVHRLLVVSADNKVIGVVAALDVLSWMARQHGFVISDARSRSRVD
jgi:CBS domain-containing protein